MPIKHHEEWRRYKTLGDKEARAYLIREFIPLVHYVFSRMSVYLPTVLDEQDLIAAGMVGMISAVNDFDSKRGVEFTTFAVPRIRGAILDELRKVDWVPRAQRRRASELLAAARTAGDATVEDADVGKMADAMGVSELQVEKLVTDARPAVFISLDGEHNSAGSRSVGRALTDKSSEDPSAVAGRADEYEAVKTGLDALPHVEKDVLIEYYFGQKLQKDIAKGLGVSRSRVSQIHKRGLDNLRERVLQEALIA